MYSTTRILACIQFSYIILMAIVYTHILFRLRNSAELFHILCDASKHQQSKMPANKPDILISPLEYNIATPSYIIFESNKVKPISSSDKYHK